MGICRLLHFKLFKLLFQKYQTMKNKDCQISVFHKFDSKYVPVFKENYTILFVSLIFKTFQVFIF